MIVDYYPSNFGFHLIYWCVFLVIGLLIINERVRYKEVDDRIKKVILVSLIWNTANILIRIIPSLISILFLIPIQIILLFIIIFPSSYYILIFLLRKILNEPYSESKNSVLIYPVGFVCITGIALNYFFPIFLIGFPL
jgi:hypothetical protein